jgi:hypothetical protein
LKTTPPASAARVEEQPAKTQEYLEEDWQSDFRVTSELDEPVVLL